MANSAHYHNKEDIKQMKKFRVFTEVSTTFHNEYWVECESKEKAWETIQNSHDQPESSVAQFPQGNERVMLIKEV